MLEARGFPPHLAGVLGPRMHHLILNRAMAPSTTSKAQQLLQGEIFCCFFASLFFVRFSLKLSASHWLLRVFSGLLCSFHFFLSALVYFTLALFCRFKQRTHWRILCSVFNPQYRGLGLSSLYFPLL